MKDKDQVPQVSMSEKIRYERSTPRRSWSSGKLQLRSSTDTYTHVLSDGGSLDCADVLA